MSQCLEKLPHSCGTTSGLQVFAREDGGVDGFCFSCSTYVRHPYGDEKQAKDLPPPKTKTPEEITQEIGEISSLPSMDLKDRKLRKSTLDFYGAKVELSEMDGKTPTIIYYPYYKGAELLGYKAKTLVGKKRLWGVGSLKGKDMFGWDQAVKQGARRLIITEGEDDAMSWYRVIELYSKEEFKTHTAVVSLPDGVSSAKKILLEKSKELQNIFSEIVLSFDMDEPGRKAVEECCIAMPFLKSIDIPEKDANECLKAGKGKALYSSLFRAVKTPKNSRLVNLSTVLPQAKQPAKWGELTWPWNHINQATRGIRLGEVIYVGAAVKMGKSEVVNALGAHFIQQHGCKVLFAKPEEENKHTAKLLAGKMVGKIFHDPKIEFDKEAFDEAEKLIGDKAFVLDIWQHMGWETLREDIISAASQGVTVVFIDPITNLTSGMDPGEANVKLEQISRDLAALAKDLEISVFVFCHLKAHDSNISKEQRDKKYEQGTFIGLGNCAHEFGGDVYSHQFAGSRAMMRACHMMIGIEGNKDPNLEPDRRSVRHLKILEDRTFGTTGIFPIKWNTTTSIFSEV